MWEIKEFPARRATLPALEQARARAAAWYDRHAESYQIVPVFICNGYAFEFRPLRRIEFADEES